LVRVVPMVVLQPKNLTKNRLLKVSGPQSGREDLNLRPLAPHARLPVLIAVPTDTKTAWRESGGFFL
jgi:hypothetical protein